MKLYIAGHSQEEARSVAQMMREAGHSITSSWLDEDFTKTGEYTDTDRMHIAIRDVREVSESDAVIVIPSPRRIPGGKFVEVGVAIGLQIPVEVLGHRENMLMHHPLVSVWNSAEDFLKSNCVAAESGDDKPEGQAENADVEARPRCAPPQQDGF